MGVNLKFFKEKVKRSDRDVSTVVLHVFLSRTSLSGLVQFWRHCIQLTRACYFQIALETMLLLILSTPTFGKILLIYNYIYPKIAGNFLAVLNRAIEHASQPIEKLLS